MGRVGERAPSIRGVKKKKQPVETVIATFRLRGGSGRDKKDGVRGRAEEGA